MRAPVGHGTFASAKGLAIEHRYDGGIGAIVASEDQISIFKQAMTFEFGFDFANEVIDVFNHVAEVALVALVSGGADAGGVPIVRVRRRHKGAVGENHRIIHQERLVLVTLNEIVDKLDHEIRCKLAIVEFESLTIFLQDRVFVALINALAINFCAPAVGVLPEQGFVEAEMLRCVFLTAELPFARDTGGVALFFEFVCKSSLAAGQKAELLIVTHIVLPRHDLHARGGADRLCVAVLKACTIGGEAVEVGRLVGFAAIGAHRLKAQVVGHDEHDIGACVSCL